MSGLKSLLVTYLPRGERSHTKKLVDAYIETLGDKEDVSHLDLLEDKPNMLDEASVAAYIKRNYLGEELNEMEKKVTRKMDSFTNQFKESDIVVMAFPMYNFSMPAMVKAYFDSVMLKGETWSAGPNGYEGLMKGKKALILIASGGAYEGESASMDHASTLAAQEFGFMGFSDIKIVKLAGVNMYPDRVEEMTRDSQKKVRDIVKDWYKL